MRAARAGAGLLDLHQAADIEELQGMLRDAVRLFFENEQDRPRVIRLHYVHDLVIAA